MIRLFLMFHVSYLFFYILMQTCIVWCCIAVYTWLIQKWGHVLTSGMCWKWPITGAETFDIWSPPPKKVSKVDLSSEQGLSSWECVERVERALLSAVLEILSCALAVQKCSVARIVFHMRILFCALILCACVLFLCVPEIWHYLNAIVFSVLQRNKTDFTTSICWYINMISVNEITVFNCNFFMVQF